MMRRKNIICIVLTAVMLLSAGCNRSTVDDAIAIDASRSENSTKNMAEATITHTEKSTEKVWVSGKKTQILEAGMNEKITYGGYELTVLDAWKTGNSLMLLDKLTGSDTFRKFIVNQHNYGDKPDLLSYSETGQYNKKDAENICIKIKIKNLEPSKEFGTTLYLSPIMFSKQGSGGAYNYIAFATPLGFDKYKNIRDINKPYKDSLSYEFEQGEEIETYLVMRLDNNVDISNLYMHSGFLNLGLGDGINDIGDGSYMIKLECSDR